MADGRRRKDRGRRSRVKAGVPGSDSQERAGQGAATRGRPLCAATLKSKTSYRQARKGAQRNQVLAVPGDPSRPLRSIAFLYLVLL